jgi:hypothetical protein
MQISHEVPVALLEMSRSFNDYDYALVHLYETEPEYLKFYKDSIELKREVILDNSVFELEEAFDAERFKYWIKETLPTYYIIPDVLDNSELTIKNVKEWDKEGLPGQTVGVIQGETFSQAVECYNEIKDHVDRIAVSFNCKFYEGEEGESIFHKWAVGRIRFVNYLAVIGNTKPLHLLGCSLPQEFKFYNEPKFDFIKSVDTSNPVVHAINDIKYTDNGLDTKVSTKLIEYMHETTFDMDLLWYNVNKFSTFCNGE